MTIVQNGSVNLGALIVPDVLVNIIPPAVSYLNGVATDIAAVVGVASWGPIGVPTLASDYPSYAQKFGALMSRKYDMGTHVACAVLQGAKNFRCVRVSDGTDVAAFVIPPGRMVFTALYSGIKGNDISIVFAPGSKPNTAKLTVNMPGQVPEVFDNISNPATDNDHLIVWDQMAAAVNNGQSLSRGPSRFIRASGSQGSNIGFSAGTYKLSGGTDGASAVTDATVIGVDGSPRTGMYALRNVGAAVATLCDVSTLNQMSTIAAFALAESTYFIQACAAGECVAGYTGTVAADSATCAVDTYALKVLAGDWCYWNDPVTQTTRLVSPAAFYIGLLANLSPQESGLNKQLYGIAGTQSSFLGGQYSQAELAVIATARFDVIAFPSVGGDYYSPRIGVNMSSDATIHGDNYSRLTPYIARTFNKALGKWVGKLQTPAQRRSAKAQADAFFQNMYDLGQIGNADGTMPFKVTLDSSNNPLSRVALGYETADAQVQYLSVIEKFIMNLQGGQSVQIASNANQIPQAYQAAA